MRPPDRGGVARKKAPDMLSPCVGHDGQVSVVLVCNEAKGGQDLRVAIIAELLRGSDEMVTVKSFKVE